MAQQQSGYNFYAQYAAKGSGSMQQQPYFCDVCKVECVGPQPYQSHMAGTKHRKKVAAAEAAKSSVGSAVISGPQAQFCELCNVSCSGHEVMLTHLRGARHKKMINSMKSRGLAIPEKYQVPPEPAPATTAAASQSGAGGTKPQIKFKMATLASLAQKTTDVSQAGGDADISDENAPSTEGSAAETLLGSEYIEALTTGNGTVVSYHCKLCECSFTDPTARLAHLNGRRHLLAYKKKVDSSVHVEIKPVSRAIQMRAMKAMRRRGQEQHWRRMDAIAGAAEEEFYANWHPAPGPRQLPWGHRPHMTPTARLHLSDHYMLKKHDTILLKHTDLASLEKIVTLCEQTLSHVSEILTDEINAEQQPPAAAATSTEAQKGTSAAATAMDSSTDDEASGLQADKTAADNNKTSTDAAAASRILVGVIRVGLFAKRIMLDGDLLAELVVVCAQKPSSSLLRRIATLMANDIVKDNSEVKYVVAMDCEETSIVVYQEQEPHWTVTINLTSPAVRQQPTDEGTATAADPEDLLDRQKCLDALAAVRRVKWFHARCHAAYWCGLVNRILRDLRRREVVWSYLSDWAQELIVEKCICYVGFHAGPTDVLRSVCECIGSGLLLPDGVGILDPCEKECVDVAENLTLQQREDLTLAAQTVARQITLRQMHKVLGMERLSQKELFSRSRHKTDETASAAADADAAAEAGDKQNGQHSDSAGDVDMEAKKQKLDSDAAAKMQ